MQVYRGMDIGTAKPTPEERAGAAWHLLDLVGCWEQFSVGRWLEAADAVIADCAVRGVPVLFEGGSPLYYRALTEGLFPGPPADRALRRELEAFAAGHGVEALHGELAAADPVAAARIERRDLRRIVRALEVHRQTGRPISDLQRQFGRRRSGFDFRVAGLRMERGALYARIDRRVDAMMAAGFLDEVRALRSRPPGPSPAALQALGYGQLGRLLDGEIDLAEAVRLTKRDTRHFARRQLGWFGRLPGIAWVDVPGRGASAPEIIDRVLEALAAAPPGPARNGTG
jgi:tRNA dimethylallyltransferase